MGNSLANPTIQSIASENVDKEEYGEHWVSYNLLPVWAAFWVQFWGELYAVVSKDAPYVASGLILFVTYLIVQKYIPGETIFEKVKRRFF